MSSTQCLLHHTYPYSYHNHSVCLINGLENWCTFSQHISRISVDMYFIILCRTIVVHNLVVSCWPCNSFEPKENWVIRATHPLPQWLRVQHWGPWKFIELIQNLQVLMRALFFSDPGRGGSKKISKTQEFTVSVCVFSCLYFLRQVFMKLRLASSSLCSRGWPNLLILLPLPHPHVGIMGMWHHTPLIVLVF